MCPSPNPSPGCPFLCAASATVGNLDELGTFLNAVVYTSSFRPVNLKRALAVGCEIFELNDNGEPHSTPHRIVQVDSDAKVQKAKHKKARVSVANTHMQRPCVRACMHCLAVHLCALPCDYSSH
jgi:hypothetical protein